MNKKTKDALISRGFPSDLIDKIDSAGHTISSLKSANYRHLRIHFNQDEISIINEKIKRKPIPKNIVESLLERSGKCCNFHSDGVSTRPYQIHHIDEYSFTQNNNEDNLILLCPTCHKTVHENNTSKEEQKSKRRNWYTKVEIAKSFAEEGIPFPYKSFFPLDYKIDPDLSELFNKIELSPSTCLKVTNNELIQKASAIIRSHKFVVIEGGSGSGKSTFAKALAATISPFSEKVFCYRFPFSDSREALEELSVFANIAVKECVLILDDVNKHVNEEELSNIISIFSTNQKIILILVCTSEGTNSSKLFRSFHEQRFVFSWKRNEAFH